jgi:hypothetical protein
MLKQEKIQVLTDREATVAVEQKIFWDYCHGHRKRLCELCANLEGALNEIVTQCLPYLGKGSTISEVVAWFKKEIRMLPDTIVKVNKSFFVYFLIAVLKMLQEHGKCYHIDGLGAIMNSCDASYGL